MTAKALKERILPQIIVNTCEGERMEIQPKLIVADKWYLVVSLVSDLVHLFCICGIKFFGCAICLVSDIATKWLS